jgi:hypothetical protein
MRVTAETGEPRSEIEPHFSLAMVASEPPAIAE